MVSHERCDCFGMGCPISRTVVSGVGIALAATIALKADDKADEGRFRLGAGVSIVMPTGNNLKSGLGLGPVFTAEMKLTNRQLLQGKLEYVHFREKDIDLETREYWQNVSSLRLGADWVYSFDSNDHGFYVLGGVSVVNDAWKSVQFDRSRALYSTRHNNFHSLLVVGGGYTFRRFAIEHTRLFDFAGRPAGYAWEIRPSGWR